MRLFHLGLHRSRESNERNYLCTNAGFVEGMTDDIALSMLSEMRTVSGWTGEVFEAVFVVHTCVMQPKGLKVKVLAWFSKAELGFNNT